MRTPNVLNSLDFTSIAKKHNLTVNQIRNIYKSYYSIIRDKMSELVTKAENTNEDVNYQETAFNIRYLGVYYLSNKLLKKKKDGNKETKSS